MLRKVLCLVFLLAVSSEAFAIGRRGSGCSSSSAASGCSSSTFTYVPSVGKVMPSTDESPTAPVPDGTVYAGTIRVGVACSSTNVTVSSGRVGRLRADRGGIFQRRRGGGCGN